MGYMGPGKSLKVTWVYACRERFCMVLVPLLALLPPVGLVPGALGPCRM